mgnify:CR=1 FL=1
MPEPLVYVLVINWNGLEHLEACFESLLAGGYANVRYLLIDNASEDGSVEFVRGRYGADPRVEILECARNLGWSGGNNAGMRHALDAGAEYVFLLNNDTAVAPDAIGKLAAMAEAHPETGALAPRMVLFDQPFILNSVGLECSLIGASWDKGVGRADTPRWHRPAPVIGVCGGAFFIRAAILHQTGLLPEHFEIYLDDLDLCLRIWKAGYTIWSCPEAVVRHKFSATFGTGKRVRRKYYLNTRNRFFVILRHFPVRKAVVVKAALAVGEARAVGRAVLDGEFWRVGAHMKAWGAALGAVPRELGGRLFRKPGSAFSGFWELIRTDRMFCPPVVLPRDGWYPEQPYRGAPWRPMSVRAWQHVGAGVLRVSHANCYPHLGGTDVRVSMAGRELARLSTEDSGSIEIEVTPGLLEFEGRHVFYAEDTGEAMDIAGWIRVEHRKTGNAPVSGAGNET